MAALFQVLLLLALLPVQARRYETCSDKSGPLDKSVVDKEFKYPLSCNPSHMNSMAIIKITRWGVYIKSWMDEPSSTLSIK